MTQIICPAKLSHGDKILVISPSGAIEPSYIDEASLVLKSWGLQPAVMPHAKNRLGRFCGTVDERLSDLQQAMDDPDAKAILCSRGGYGIVHLLDKVSFSGIKKHPKWLIGYSDITALHAAFYINGLMSLHAPMAKHLVQDTDSMASHYLKEILFGSTTHYQVAPNRLNRPGKASGKLVGGNLAVICNLLGTPYLNIPEGTILFVEDIAEKPYQIDRMMWHLKLAGVFDRIAGLVVGRFTEYQEDPLMYSSVYESIRELMSDYNFPLCFDFPVGHVVENYPLVHGAETILQVTPHKASLDQERMDAFF